ncbi:MAG: hypothetical protein AB7L92_02875 [Alphaproteobacteria bacterium]
MDDKTLIASYVAGEAERINQKLKAMMNSETKPTDEQRDEVIRDIEVTLARLQNALSNITLEVSEEDEEEYEQTVQ